MADQSASPVTAALLVIGDEILSGRTKDKNIGFIAELLTSLGIDLREVRVVADDEEAIVEALNALRVRNDYLFTTGGIGPTHDDITAAAVARAFGRKLLLNQDAVEMLKTRIAESDLNAARLRMATVPEGATLIPNAVSAAPGFRVDNVFVMAGVPVVMQSMMEAVAPTLKTGAVIVSESLDTDGVLEGDYAASLADIAGSFPSISIGSYPMLTTSGFRNQIVVRGRDAAEVRQAREQVARMLENTPKRR
ncbi:MAG: competence/damage-inducible protein A [Methylobacteriaceae bacterium]|jgi:molybdenum cofactor synthesis domain-containing protein|nr:competence/damage-inducible protein A [Methylobacteriaceae bacterium]